MSTVALHSLTNPIFYTGCAGQAPCMITLLFNPFTVVLLWLGASAPFVAFFLREGATPAVNTGIFLFCWGMLDCLRLSVAFMPLALRWSIAMR